MTPDDLLWRIRRFTFVCYLLTALVMLIARPFDFLMAAIVYWIVFET